MDQCSFGAMLTTLLVLSVRCIMVKSQPICTDIALFENNLQRKYLSGSEFRSMPQMTLLGCVKECQLRKRCVSFNFDVSSGDCVLNEGSSLDSKFNFSDSPDSVYSEVDGWKGVAAGVCASHSCDANTACAESESGQYECVVESCMDPPAVTKAKVMTSSRHIDVGSAVPYECTVPFLPAGEITCLANGTWSGKFQCMRLRTCGDIKVCNSSYGDGEYWIYVRPDEHLLKVYCQDMANISEPFLTLQGNTYYDLRNISAGCKVPWPVGNCGKTVFHKINLGLWENVFKPWVYTFATSDCSPSSLGWAGNCPQCPDSPAHGSFRIDTNGTGIKVADSFSWIGVVGSSAIWNRTHSGTIITGECLGVCDYCISKMKEVTDERIPFEFDPSHKPDLSEAIFPKCSPPVS